tara:strand:+ start:301 stop:516 length:216 start_codon:yes stop_codon:yes gene_type:complete
MPCLEDEATSRNYILNVIHGKIPSYALWDNVSIGSKTKEENLEWWLYYTKHESLLIKHISKYWYKHYLKCT